MDALKIYYSITPDFNMRKNIGSLFLLLIMAGSFGCSKPDTSTEASTTEFKAKAELDSTATISSSTLESQDTVTVGSEVKALGNEVDSLLKDI